MRSRVLALIGAMAVASAITSLTSAQIAAQAAAKPAAPAANRSIPRTLDGHPDLTGVYDLATLTPVERPANLPAILTDAEAKKLEQQEAQRRELGARQIKGDRDAPPKGGDGSVGPAGNVGGYNSFWIDRGTHYTEVDGQKRSSIVIDPPDGKVPSMTAEARQRQVSRFAAARLQSDATENAGDPGLEPAGAYDGPERRPLGERCLLGFGSTSGPPILPDYFYNNLHQIVQTRDAVMILTEMVHDVRIVRIAATHLPSSIRKWMGDSIGRWDGDTL